MVDRGTFSPTHVILGARPPTRPPFLACNVGLPPDIFALHPDEVLRLQYHDPARARLDHAALADDRLTVIARNREATALYAWEPYFHDPKLRRRLHRITVPTLLLWGADDRFVTADYYGAAYRDAIPGARLETIAGAGHFPHLEQPEALAERVRAFALA